ncbi:MAG: SLC13 family permease [Flavobacteriales bacterium]|nr:SLC13 family permease [Flavobacteriales bacterium]
MENAPQNSKASLLKKIFFWLAPLLSLSIVLFGDLDPERPETTYTLAVAVLMAIWWMTDVVPLAITSLLPLLLFPLFGVMDGKVVSATYFNHIIFLFLGGFLVALAIEKWGLHKRIALRILSMVGSSPARIMLGFMLATAFLSMWISNTATTMMMVPILISIISKLEEVNGREKISNYAIGMLLAVAYSSSIGGISTLVGTAPNLSFVRILETHFPNAPEINFTNWFLFALPITIILFILLYVYLYFLYVRKKTEWKNIDKSEIKQSYRDLGKVTFEEKVLIVAFVSMALLWFFRADIQIGQFRIPGWSNLFPEPGYFNDGTVAIFIAIILFLIPSKQKKPDHIMDWKTSTKIPWEIILLFGGGFALAAGIKESGLSNWFGEQLLFLKGVHPLILILCITFLITFLTEITSNTATVETFLPILAGLAMSIESNPILFMIPATIAGSMAFMLPVATPPNAIVFGTKRLRMAQMARTGLVLNLIAITVIALMTYFYGTEIFNADPTVYPDWAK